MKMVAFKMSAIKMSAFKISAINILAIKMSAINMAAVFTHLSIAELCMHSDSILTSHLNTPENTPMHILLYTMVCSTHYIIMVYFTLNTSVFYCIHYSLIYFVHYDVLYSVPCGVLYFVHFHVLKSVQNAVFSVTSYVSLTFHTSLSSSQNTTLPDSPDLPPPHPHPTGPMQQATLHRQSQDQPLVALGSYIMD